MVVTNTGFFHFSSSIMYRKKQKKKRRYSIEYRCWFFRYVLEFRAGLEFDFGRLPPLLYPIQHAPLTLMWWSCSNVLRWTNAQLDHILIKIYNYFADTYYFVQTIRVQICMCLYDTCTHDKRDILLVHVTAKYVHTNSNHSLTWCVQNTCIIRIFIPIGFKDIHAQRQCVCNNYRARLIPYSPDGGGFRRKNNF